MKKSDIKQYSVVDRMYVNGEPISISSDPMTAQDIIDMLIFRKHEGYKTRIGLTKYDVIVIDSYIEDTTEVVVLP